MGETKILVSGTAKNFASHLPIFKSVPEFALFFESSEFNLISEGKGKFLVMFNHNKSVYSKFVKTGGISKNAILVRLEPDSVFPAQYKKRIEKKYGLIISLGAAKSTKPRVYSFGWPYKYHLNPAEPSAKDPALESIINSICQEKTYEFKNWIKRSHNLVMVAGNKVSPLSNSNYAIRRKLARQLPPELIEIYRPLWNDNLYLKLRHRLAVLVGALKQGSIPNLNAIYASPFERYKTTKGPIANKHKLLQDSKFSLVIENSNSIVTEKIFDALINGAIPIYVGPDLANFCIPKNIALEVTGESKEIELTINNLDESKIRLLLHEMNEFINSEYFKSNWRSDFVYKNVAEKIKSYVRECE